MNRMIRTLSTLLIFAGLIVAALPAHADGLLMVEGVYRQPFSSKINVQIEDKIATTTLEQTFRNPLDKQVAAVYVAPVPDGATITGFAQLMDGQWVEAEIKDADQAKKEFEEAQEQGKDAALTGGQVVGGAIDPRMTFQTRLVLPPQSERSVRLTYTEVLSGEVGLTRYTYPLSNTNLSAEPVGDLLVNVKIIEKDEIRAVYSPSHPNGLEIARPEKTQAEAVYRAQNVVPDKDFEIVYTQSADKFGLNLASYRDAKEQDGYFVLIAAPQLEVAQSEVVQKDFVFVLDRSGSMNGAKFDQARTALKRIIDMLNPGDRFTIVAFESGVSSFYSGLLPLDRRESARQWVDEMEIGGGTNINDALLTALSTVDQASGRQHIVVFLTDGQATEGVTATTDILRNIRSAIRPQSRIYTIGIGDVNQALLESLAQENRGTSLFLDAFQQIDKPIGDFYAGINSPVLVDLALDFGGIEVYDLHPNPIPDMFLGGQVVLTGRYKGSGLTTVTLTGNVNGVKHTSTYKDIKFTDPKDAETKMNRTNAFVPRLWAQRKVDSLVRSMAINGPDNKLIEEVKSLGMRYKIVTPYTSFVVTEKQGQKVAALPQTGLPFLYADDYRVVNTTLMIAGALLALAGVIGMMIGRLRRA